MMDRRATIRMNFNDMSEETSLVLVWEVSEEVEAGASVFFLLFLLEGVVTGVPMSLDLICVPSFDSSILPEVSCKKYNSKQLYLRKQCTNLIN